MKHTVGHGQNGPEVPLGLGMALAENPQAMQYFSSQTPQRRQELIDQTHQFRSKQDMQRFVSGLAQGEQPPSFF